MSAATEAILTIFPREPVRRGSCFSIRIIAYLQQIHTPLAFTAIARSRKKFDNYVRNLEKTNHTYAFFADLRDFVQHCGLPTGHMQRTATRVGKVTLTVTAEASWLVENCGNWRQAWQRSGLTKDSGCFDLISMRDLRHLLIEDFGKFTASIYGPPLLETHNFFATLDIDAEKAMGDGARTVLVESFESQPGEKGAVHFHVETNVETSFIPRDVFREVGITLTPIPVSQS